MNPLLCLLSYAGLARLRLSEQKKSKKGEPPKMRVLFNDGWNSFARAACGAIALVTMPFLGVTLFVVYQAGQEDQRNTIVDLVEFGLGYAVMWRMAKIQGVF